MNNLGNQTGYSDSFIILVVGAILGALFILGVFVWREHVIYQNVNNFFSAAFSNFNTQEDNNTVDSFEDCVAAGQAVLESYPRQCVSTDGQIFVEVVEGYQVPEVMIKVSSPQGGQIVSSPLKILGQAKGPWFFEGDFPIILLDQNQNKIAVGIATAQGDWMTEGFVDFTAELEFDSPESELGFLIFKKDNPSGLPENDDQYQVPVFFEN